MSRLSRLLRPRSIALFGGGWADNVLDQLLRADYPGAVWPVHPRRTVVRGRYCYPGVDALPAAPDASFVGVNRDATVDVVAALAARGAGGAVCFASGFAESDPEQTGGGALQDRLVAAAGTMPLLGPNCYGLLNYLDGVALWPDQHGGVRVGRGVAIIAQSSNVAINLTMQRRGVPLAYVLTVGNQAQTGVGALLDALLDDDRVTAVGLYLEGFGELPTLARAAARARARGVPLVALKSGRSAAARAAALSHTASLSGGAAAAAALLNRLGIAEVEQPDALLEALKLLHHGGPLAGPSVASVSCSGGEAALVADAAGGTRLRFPPFDAAGRARLRGLLGARVAIANPLDYHTYIWGDRGAMRGCFGAVLDGGFDLALFVLDVPRADRCDPSGWDCAVDAIIAARRGTDARAAVLALLPENLPEALIERFAAAGVATLCGLRAGIDAVDATIAAGELRARGHAGPLLIAGAPSGADAVTLSEADGKRALAGFGLRVPASVEAGDVDALLARAREQGVIAPYVLKRSGVAHKSEVGAVAVGLGDAAALRRAAAAMAGVGDGFLLETMAAGVAEALLGVSRDAGGALLLTLGAGGVLAELLDDTATLALPASREQIDAALAALKFDRLLCGYRGRPRADRDALLDAACALCRYAAAERGRLLELDVNPLIVGERGAVAADVLIRLTA